MSIWFSVLIGIVANETSFIIRMIIGDFIFVCAIKRDNKLSMEIINVCVHFR